MLILNFLEGCLSLANLLCYCVIGKSEKGETFSFSTSIYLATVVYVEILPMHVDSNKFSANFLAMPRVLY